MTHKKNYRTMLESLMAGQEGTRHFSTLDAQEILKRLGFKDETKKVEHAKNRKHATFHNQDSVFIHSKPPDFRLNITKAATLSWEDKKEIVKAVQKLLAVELNALERLEPGYAARIAQETAEQQFRQ